MASRAEVLLPGAIGYPHVSEGGLAREVDVKVKAVTESLKPFSFDRLRGKVSSKEDLLVLSGSTHQQNQGGEIDIMTEVIKTYGYNADNSFPFDDGYEWLEGYSLQDDWDIHEQIIFPSVTKPGLEFIKTSSVTKDLEPIKTVWQVRAGPKK